MLQIFKRSDLLDHLINVHMKTIIQDIKILDNSGNKLSDTELNKIVNEVLETLTGMQYLNLTNMEQLNNIKFVKNMPNLLEIIFYGTNVITGTNNDSGEQIGLELLENNSKLKILALSNLFSV